MLVIRRLNLPIIQYFVRKLVFCTLHGVTALYNGWGTCVKNSYNSGQETSLYIIDDNYNLLADC